MDILCQNDIEKCYSLSERGSFLINDYWRMCICVLAPPLTFIVTLNIPPIHMRGKAVIQVVICFVVNLQQPRETMEQK